MTPRRASTSSRCRPGSPRPTGSRIWLRSRAGATPSCPATASPIRRTASWMVVPGRWQLAGVSPNGRFAALARQPVDKRRTDVVVVNLTAGRVAHRLDLRGDFEVETVSRDGKRLFLIEHLPGDRPAALPRQALRSLAGQARLEAPARQGRAERDGRAGLERRRLARRPLAADALPEHGPQRRVRPRARPRAQLTALHLPSFQRGFGALKRYGLTLSPDGQRLYATNAALGAVAEIDLATRKVVRTTRFAATRQAQRPRLAHRHDLAERAHALLQPGTGPLGLRHRLRGRAGPVPDRRAIAGFGFSLGDRRVHALRADGRLLSFDAATGEKVA